MGYPVARAELDMLDTHSAANPLDDLEPVTDAAEIAKLIEVVRTVHVSQAVKQYAVDLTSATRRSPDLRLGASPRATLHLVRAARAHAALESRDYVIPDDIQQLAVSGARPPADHRPGGTDGRPRTRADRRLAAADDHGPRGQQPRQPHLSHGLRLRSADDARSRLPCCRGRERRSPPLSSDRRTCCEWRCCCSLLPLLTVAARPARSLPADLQSRRSTRPGCRPASPPRSSCGSRTPGAPQPV